MERNTLTIPVGEFVRYSVTERDVQEIQKILQANHISERGVPKQGTVLPMLVTESQGQEVHGQLFLNGPCIPFYAESSTPGQTEGSPQQWRQQAGQWLPLASFYQEGQTGAASR